MTEGIEFDVVSAEDAAAERDEVVAAVESHAGEIARELALLHGGDYGQETFETAAGEWTVKYEAGALQYLRYDPDSGRETYVVSTKQPPEPEALAAAMGDYRAFVESYNRHVRALDGVFADVRTDFPAVESTESVVVERDRIVGRIEDIADVIAGELHRYDGTDYGTFSVRVGGKRWELKRDHGRASYLRVGGQDGVYLVSQYEPPSAPDLRRLADGFADFVAAYNEHVEELEADLSTVSFDG